MGSKPYATLGELIFLSTATWLLTASAALGTIRDPTLSELVESADLIVVGTTESVRAAAWLVVVVVVVAVLHLALIACAIRCAMKRRWAGLAVSVTALIVLVLAVLPGRSALPHGDRYAKVARVRVEEVVQGACEQTTIAVSYDTGFVCDATEFVAGGKYVLFLRQQGTGYTVSWHDWSQWEVDGDEVQTPRRQSHEPAPVPLTLMRQAVRSRSPDKLVRMSGRPESDGGTNGQPDQE